jgi:DNA-3-methyladenine glycosylase I
LAVNLIGPDERCGWANGSATMEAYHDAEWGLPRHDDRILFEYLLLDSFQAGLSWSCILNKREGFRQAFANFDMDSVARFNGTDVSRLLQDASIVRHRGKIEAAIGNAQAALKAREEFGSLDAYLWRFVEGAPIVNQWAALAEIPAQSRESEAMSRDLRQRGFRFVGPTICYAFMQGAGLVDDHLTSCFRRLNRR